VVIVDYSNVLDLAAKFAPSHRRQIDEMDEWQLEDPEVKSIPSGKLQIFHPVTKNAF